MTALQLFFLIRSRLARFGMPLVIGAFLIGACVPAKHSAAPQPVQLSTAINRGGHTSAAEKKKAVPSVHKLLQYLGVVRR